MQKLINAQEVYVWLSSVKKIIKNKTDAYLQSNKEVNSVVFP